MPESQSIPLSTKGYMDKPELGPPAPVAHPTEIRCKQFKWTPEEDAVLKQMWEGSLTTYIEDIMEVLPWRTFWAIRNRLSRQGIYRVYLEVED